MFPSSHEILCFPAGTRSHSMVFIQFDSMTWNEFIFIILLLSEISYRAFRIEHSRFLYYYFISLFYLIFIHRMCSVFSVLIHCGSVIEQKEISFQFISFIDYFDGRKQLPFNYYQVDQHPSTCVFTHVVIA